MRRGSSAKGVLLEHLDARQGEIEEAVLSRVHSVGDPVKVEDPEYVTGLGRAVRVALGHSISALHRKEPRQEAVPAELITQARAAARNRVGLETVLRRYFAGHAVLSEFIVGEANQCLLESSTLRFMLGAQAALLDRIVAAVSAEYGEEVGRQHRSFAARIERIEALLAGEPVDHTELAYDFDGWHLGVIARGHDAGPSVAKMAAACDRRLLAVERDEMTVWGWLGGRRRFGAGDLCAIASSQLPPGVSLVLGETAPRLDGWRLTHQQARAALPVALENRGPITRYADVSLLASAVQDDVLSRSLNYLFMAPLAGEKDGGAAVRETLRAYFACDRNATSAAAALGVTRQTVNNRLRVIEQRLGREIAACSVELDLALRLEMHGESLLP